MIENPYRKIRRRLRLSVKGLSLNRSTVARIEAGAYESLSDRMCAVLFMAVTARGVDTDIIAADLERTYGTPYLQEAYQKWRKLKRAEEGDGEWPMLWMVEKWTQGNEISPFEAFAQLSSMSIAKFCRRFCLQVSTVENYAHGNFSYASGPPQALREALTDAGYDSIDELFEMQGMWLDERERRSSDDGGRR